MIIILEEYDSKSVMTMHNQETAVTYIFTILVSSSGMKLPRAKLEIDGKIICTGENVYWFLTQLITGVSYDASREETVNIFLESLKLFIEEF